jgi:putative transposase
LLQFDYSQGGEYFVTICAHSRRHRFGSVVNGAMRCNDIGRIVAEEWLRTAVLRRNVRLDEFTVMPNHFHGILMLAHIERSPLGETFGSPTQNSLPSIIRGFKGAVTRRLDASALPLWQRGYYEHVIRDEKALERIREYIIENPARWHLDRENADRVGNDEFDRWIDWFKRPGRAERVPPP